jgi:hypothetical protein
VDSNIRSNSSDGVSLKQAIPTSTPTVLELPLLLVVAVLGNTIKE